jgi:hypothetical protein
MVIATINISFKGTELKEEREEERQRRWGERRRERDRKDAEERRVRQAERYT